MIIGIGTGTKRLNELLGSNKSYLATAKIGERTNTLDHTGVLIEKSAPELFDFQRAAKTLMPTYEQTPPIYSSIKIQGIRLHELARNSAETQAEAPELLNLAAERKRSCTIFSFEVLDTSWPLVTFNTTVSKGTYIRSLANDIAKTQNSYATLHKLTRTQIGEIPLSEALLLEKITDCVILETQLLKNTVFFNSLPQTDKDPS
jgi:tRNA pseudouridine55 synthase